MFRREASVLLALVILFTAVSLDQDFSDGLLYLLVVATVSLMTLVLWTWIADARRIDRTQSMFEAYFHISRRNKIGSVNLVVTVGHLELPVRQEGLYSYGVRPFYAESGFWAEDVVSRTRFWIDAPPKDCLYFLVHESDVEHRGQLHFLWGAVQCERINSWGEITLYKEF